MPLRFLVKTAITVVTPPVVFFHSFPLPVTHVFFFAVLLRNQGRTTAEPRRCDCGHDDPIELPLRFDGGATAIIGGRTAVLAVALRCQGGSMTSARRLNMGCGFRSYYRFRRCQIWHLGEGLGVKQSNI